MAFGSPGVILNRWDPSRSDLYGYPAFRVAAAGSLVKSARMEWRPAHDLSRRV